MLTPLHPLDVQAFAVTARELLRELLPHATEEERQQLLEGIGGCAALALRCKPIERQEARQE